MPESLNNGRPQPAEGVTYGEWRPTLSPLSALPHDCLVCTFQVMVGKLSTIPPAFYFEKYLAALFAPDLSVCIFHVYILNSDCSSASTSDRVHPPFH